MIGKDGGMPWHVPEDMARFRAATTGAPVVMGRRTWESFPDRFRPLPGRRNIVVTRDRAFQAPGIVVATSLDAAHDIALGDALRRFATEIMVIGGAEIFAQWFAIADRLEITEVHSAPEGDTFLKPVNLAEWQETARTSHSKGDGDTADFSYVTYERRR